jgi:hypothetical protein
MASAGLHGQTGSAVVLDAVPVKDLSFQKLQYGMNQVGDLQLLAQHFVTILS